MKWVRPSIAWLFALGITVGFFQGLVIPEAYLPIAAAAITWWFKSRDEDKRPDPPAL